MDLVVGATGHLGGLLTRRLIERGGAVRALIRSSSSDSDLPHSGAEIVIGDLTDVATLPAACAGVERILATATAASRGGDDTVESVDRTGYMDLLKAAESGGIDRFLFVSAHGFETDSPVGLARAKAATEEALRKSGLGYTIVRPAFFMEAWIGLVVGAQLEAGHDVTIIGDPDRPYPFVALANVADLALAALDSEDGRNQTITLVGGLASYRQVTTWVGEALEIDIQIHSLPPGSAMPGMPPIIPELWSWAATSLEAVETPDTVTRFGLDLVSPQDWVRQAFKI